MKKNDILAGMLLTVDLVCMACGSTVGTTALRMMPDGLRDDGDEVCRNGRTTAWVGITMRTQ